MAYSPCPKCQSKVEFDARKIDTCGFLVQRGSVLTAHPLLQCTRVPEHTYDNHEQAVRDLRAMGYLGRCA